MPRYKKISALKSIGKRLKKQRESQKLQIEDVVEMTGFTYKKISDVEAGEETSLSYFIEICLAIKIHPKEILDFNFGSKPRFELSSTRKEKPRLTPRLNEYIKIGFFKTPRYTGEIVAKLKVDFGIVSTSSNVSAILRRLVNNGSLIIIKRNRRNYYREK
ncbi:helix-turn-helix domain-containing protein [Flagellimonas lutimaris]|uniref:helix-turn-helix domain-containing protein n=1 Tax=Flagellimonas lutimaris TaxID=475082 RepID=UPI0039C00AF7